LTIPLAISIGCIIYLIYSHIPKKEYPPSIVGKEIHAKKAKGERDSSFIEFKDKDDGAGAK